MGDANSNCDDIVLLSIIEHVRLLECQHVNTFETKMILGSILYKNFQNFCFKMPKVTFTIDYSRLCF
jgi:hypothetical protein